MSVYVLMESSTSNGGGSIHDCCTSIGVYAQYQSALDAIRNMYADIDFKYELEHGFIFEEGVKAIREAKSDEVWLDESRVWVETREVRV